MNVSNQTNNVNPYLPNSTQVPNILFDYWMEVLSPAEFKVLMCIARKTYGWAKSQDLISFSQIEKMTGLSHRGILKNIHALIGHGIVLKVESFTADGDAAPNLYQININCENRGVGNSVPYPVHSVQGVGNSVPSQNTYIPIKESNVIYNTSKNTPPNLQDSEATSSREGGDFKKLTPREKGTNPRNLGTNPRALGTNPKAVEALAGEKIYFGDRVLLSQKEYDELKIKCLNLDAIIEEMNDWIAAKGKDPYKSHYHALKQWIRKRANEPEKHHVSKPKGFTLCSDEKKSLEIMKRLRENAI